MRSTAWGASTTATAVIVQVSSRPIRASCTQAAYHVVSMSEP
jgi:hypothetical protein